MNSRKSAVAAEAREEMARRFASNDFLVKAVRTAVREAVRDHKRAGNPIASWQDGRVVIVAPEDIPDFADE
jgi:hypothetical protein